ncbi:MAG: LysM peptidoglycan-binding domain-containing protein [Chloroflexi bacterium]|nr:LysM peptidoglycan-binding domain-containing protein [Chloroflexota bacterium]
MTQISHEEARSLINFNADQALDADKHSILNAHLNNCTECKSYASELSEVENILHKLNPTLDRHPTPMNLDRILGGSKNAAIGFANSFTVTKMAMMILAVIAVVIGSWQFSIIGVSSPTATYTAIPIPTPSTYLTSVNEIFLDCEFIEYQVQAGDTLDIIALQFSVTKELIMDFNHMQEENIQPSMHIRIPTCAQTPTITIYPPNTTITITPQFEPITSTPG